MPLEARTVVSKGIGSLAGCLVEGDPEQRVRERKVRRRALAISVTLQTIVLAVVVIFPLFAKPPLVGPPSFVPIPPYTHSQQTQQTNVRLRQQTSHSRPGGFFAPTSIPTGVRPQQLDDTPTPIGDFIDGHAQNPGPITPGLNVFDTRPQPPAPQSSQQRRIMVGGRVQAAMLVYRVEPVYPTLMRQIRKSGRVELRAIISTDGTMESLQVISGDAGFFQSALDAVRQWRYKPTILNGQPVEVETNITVIYNIGP